MKPFFSVIIPTLNEELYLPKLLEDLSKQKYNNFEVIVIDGKSEDKTINLAKQFKKYFNLKLILTTMRNSRYQRNLGAKMAKGKFIVLFEADIRIPDDFLKQVQQRIKDKHIDFLTTWIASDSNSFWLEIFTSICNCAVYFAKFINKPFSGAFNTVVRRDIYLKVKGYREDLATCDDHDFTLRVCKEGYKLDILRGPKVVYSYRRYRANGLFKTLWLYIKFIIIFLMRGQILAGEVHYPMGGHFYRNQQGNEI